MAKYEYRYRETYHGVEIDVRAHTQKELMRKVEARKKDVLRGDYTRCTVKQWRERYLEVYKRPLVSDSWYGELERYSAKLAPIDHLMMERVRPSNLQAILNTEKGKSESSIRMVYHFVCSLFRQAWRENMIRDDITKGLVLPSGSPKCVRRAITPKERVAVLSVAEKHPKGLFLLIMLYAGLRPGEVRALQWKDIDLSARFISVTKAAKEGSQVGMPKTKAGVRKVPICAELMPHLHRGMPFEYVCPNEAGRIMTEQNYKDMWISVKRMMHIELGGKLYRNQMVPPLAVAPDFTLYCLRHTYGTDLEKKGVPINIAKVLMGHEDISTTAKIYTHFDDETLALALALIDGAGHAPGHSPVKLLKNQRS